MKFAIVVPWHNPKQRDAFLAAWGVGAASGKWLFMQQDISQAGCAVTKNAGIARALAAGAEYIVVIDDDCLPPESIQQIAGPLKGVFAQGPDAGYTLEKFAEDHIAALQPQPVRMVYPTTQPQSRGMPYRNHHLTLPVAASMGFWQKNPDFDAMATLVHGPAPETLFTQIAMYQFYFPFSGMNFAFHRKWAEEAVLINVPRYDDIWMGLIWQKIAYEKGYCFSLRGPTITHSRQSNVWKNLQDEVRYIETNETMWSAVHSAPAGLSAGELRTRIFGSAGPASLPQEPKLLPPSAPMLELGAE